MYEVGMSANGRIEPCFEPAIEHWEGPAPISLGSEHLTFEEETNSGTGSMLVKSALVMLIAISSYGSYEFFKDSNSAQQLASTKPLQSISNENLNEEPNTNIRKIDLTTTASIPKSVSKSNLNKTNSIGKPIPIETRKLATDNKFHIVQPGDTLSGIGRKFNVSAADIMEINAIEDARRIKPGMKLFVTK